MSWKIINVKKIKYQKNKMSYKKVYENYKNKKKYKNKMWWGCKKVKLEKLKRI